MKKGKSPFARHQFGSKKEFHRKLEQRLELTLKDTYNTANIQKAFGTVIEADCQTRILTHQEFIEKQAQSGWKANVATMDCWNLENLDKLEAHYQSAYIGANPEFGLKKLPPRGREITDSSLITRAIEESINLSKHITTEVQNMVTEAKEAVDKEKKAQRIDEEKASKAFERDAQGRTLGVIAESTEYEQIQDENGVDGEVFDTEFRTSVHGYSDIASFALRESKDPISDPKNDVHTKPMPKTNFNPPASKTSVMGNVSHQTTSRNGAIASTSTARSMIAAAAKKNAKQGKNTSQIQSFFKSVKGHKDFEDDPGDLL